MLKIGIFSKLSRINVRMLRYYDDMDLLKPCRIDGFTGYRYYSEEQLITAERIAALRELGFGLAQIRELMAQEGQREIWEEALLHQREVLRQEERALQGRLLLLEVTLARLRKDDKTMEYPVMMKDLPGRYVASVRKRIANYWQEQELWNTLAEETCGINLQVCSPCYAMAIFHDQEHVEQNPDVEIQMAVKGTYPDTASVRFKTVPSMRIASATCKGPYDQLPDVTGAVAQWVRDNGYAFDGPSFLIYHISPHETQNPEEYVTEVCFSVRKV